MSSAAGAPGPPAGLPARRIAVVGPLTGGSLSVAECAVRALRRLGHQVSYVDNSGHMDVLRAIEASADPPATKLHMRDAFLDMVRAQSRAATLAARPQLVLFLAQAPALRDEDVAELRQADVPTIFWFVEDHRVFPYWRTLVGGAGGGRFDHFWTIQSDPAFVAQLRQGGQRFVDQVPLACDPELHRPRPAQEWGPLASPVSFVGSAYPNRLALLTQLVGGAAPPPLLIYGPGWTAAPALRPFIGRDGLLPHDDLPRLFSASQINLNLSSAVDPAAFAVGKDFVNPRAFEIAASGGFQLIEALAPVQPFFAVGQEIVTFTGAQDARQKIAHYLAHEQDRLRIASAGRRRALADHTYDVRLARALARAAEQDPRLLS